MNAVIVSTPLESADRRYFLGRLTVTIAGVALAPQVLARALPVVCHADRCGDWTLDDICGAYPPYAFHTGAARPHSLPSLGVVADIDRDWVV